MEDERKINWLSLFIKIIIVFVFILIIIWLISKIINNNKLSETFKNNINNMEEVATTYFKKIDLPTEEGKSIKLTLEEMIEKEIIVSMNEDSKNTCNVKKSYSKITRNKKDYTIENVAKAVERAKNLHTNNSERWPKELGSHVYLLVDEFFKLLK